MQIKNIGKNSVSKDWTCLRWEKYLLLVQDTKQNTFKSFVIFYSVFEKLYFYYGAFKKLYFY